MDIIAHPITLWLLGLLGGWISTARHRGDDGRRLAPWTWATRNPGRIARALIGSALGLGILHGAGWLDTQPTGGILAAGLGLLGAEALDRLQETARTAARAALERLGKRASKGG